jgi:hypothetical protein
MKADLLKSYLKYNYKYILLSLAIFILLSYLTHAFAFYLFCFFLGTGREYYLYNAKLDKIKRLKAKGLTEQDLRNIEFVKKWEEYREGGLWKYCIRDGGIIAGAGLSVVISLMYFATAPNGFKNVEANPGNMFSLIGDAYIAGAAIGVIMYRILWWCNEKRFMRLTDPFNILFASKKASFNDPA